MIRLFLIATALLSLAAMAQDTPEHQDWDKALTICKPSQACYVVVEMYHWGRVLSWHKTYQEAAEAARKHIVGLKQEDLNYYRHHVTGVLRLNSTYTRAAAARFAPRTPWLDVE